jgi:thiol-disulfide isomerase/thioredoxin
MAGLALAAILLIGTVIYSLSQLNGTPESSSLADLSLEPTLRQNLPHFEYSDEGKVLKPENFAGHWTLLTFWAHWCAPCLEEMPSLNSLSQQWQGANFEILTVNVDDPKSEEFEAARRFLSEQDLALPTLFDRKGELQKAFDVKELPRHFLINPQQQIVWQAKGAFQWSDNKARDQLMRVMTEEAEEPDAATEEPAGDEAIPSSEPAEPAK